MKSLAVFLTHDFKPLFRQTLARLESSLDVSLDVMILMDSSGSIPSDLNSSKIPIRHCKRHPSSFDPLGQAHNFYIDVFQSNPDLIESYDYIWIVENDVYYHGNMREFFDIHSSYDHDLLVPEFGLRHREWCWLSQTEGISSTPVGVTAVIYRASSRFMRFMIQNVNGLIRGHMEVVLPHLCIDHGFSIQQFIPDHMGAINTFRTPLIGAIEKDLSEGSSTFIERKLYHPVKR